MGNFATQRCGGDLGRPHRRRQRQRPLESSQLTAKQQVAAPVNWKQGEDVIIVPAVPDEAAKAKYPGGWKVPKPCLRIIPQSKG